MNEIVHYTQCPVCRSAAISKVFSCKDFTVSQQLFEVWKCSSCTARFTQDVPDEAHISPYYQSANYVSHSDTRKGVINKIYHYVRAFTLRGKRALVIKATGHKTGVLLDAGAGTGSFAHVMQKAGWSVTAIEPDETARAKAYETHQLEMQAPNQVSQLQTEGFDAITMWHVLEHVHDLHGYMSTFKKLLRPDGKLFIAVPNYTGYDAKTYNNLWAAYDVPRHLYHFSPKSMDVLLAKHGFVVQEVQPMWFDSFYVSMLSEKHKEKQGNLLKACWYGLVTDFKTVSDKKNSSSLIYIIRKG